jgi:hypothetical protein
MDKPVGVWGRILSQVRIDVKIRRGKARGGRPRRWRPEDDAGAAAGDAAIPAGSLRTGPGTGPGPPTVPWLDRSAAAAAAPMSRRAATHVVTAVRKLFSSSQELMAPRSRTKPAGRA